MNRDRSTLIWGIVLVAVGALLLLQTLGALQGLADTVVALAFVAIGVVFTAMYAARREVWWPIIPGLTMLGLGVLVGLATASPRLGDVAGAPVFLGAIGASFWVVYATDRRQWWAIIPGGVLLSVAVMVLLEALVSFDVAWVLMLGMAITFLVVSFQRNEKGERFFWALIPAGVLAIIAFGLAVAGIPALGRVWPLALVAGGGVLVWRALRGKQPVE